MITQEKKILCTNKEPDRNHLWLRPRYGKEGYDLLYFGSRGWIPLLSEVPEETDEPDNDCFNQEG